MSLFKQVKKDLKKYQPQLVKVTLLGNIRAGETKEGNTIISLDVNDDGQLPVNEDRLKTYIKRICFATEKIANHYIDHPDGDPKEKVFILPMTSPDDSNTYWIRRIFAEPTEVKGK